MKLTLKQYLVRFMRCRRVAFMAEASVPTGPKFGLSLRPAKRNAVTGCPATRDHVLSTIALMTDAISTTRRRSSYYASQQNVLWDNNGGIFPNGHVVLVAALVQNHSISDHWVQCNIFPLCKHKGFNTVFQYMLQFVFLFDTRPKDGWLKDF